jgi:hypothetical protein
MSKEEINDLSKADVFTKLFACVQSIWLVVQSIARVSVGLPITQLELATIALVFCALIMYALWWNKPFGVERTVTIHTIYDGNISATIAAIKRTELDPARLEWSRHNHVVKFSNIIDETHGNLESYFKWRLKATFPGLLPPNLSYGMLVDMALNTLADTERNDLVEFGKALVRMTSNIFGKSRWISIDREFATCITFYAAGTLFSAFHIGAWNWEFPTSTVRTIWRSFALAATGAGPLAVIVVIIGVATIDSLGSRLRLRHICGSVTIGALGLLLVAYVLARLGLVVLVFYCFSSMPAAVYETVNWTEFLPHFA